MNGKMISYSYKYSEKDTKRIEQLQKELNNYSEDLLYRLRSDGLNWAATHQEINKMYLEDIGLKMRAELLKKAIEASYRVSILTCTTENEQP
ncbi:MAG: hypothetical protein AAF512_01860 [Pseudomonadota bacterium]